MGTARQMPVIGELNERSREIFRQIVDAYVETGEPVGSRSVAQRMGMGLSPATIRNVMADLTDAGLLYAPHTSAGRMPTDLGLQLFVDGLLEIGALSQKERREIANRCKTAARNPEDVLAEASAMLSGLSSCAGLVVAPKLERPWRQIEFVPLSPGRALVVMVTTEGLVENRIIELPADLPASALVTAGNYLNARMNGATLEEMRETIAREMEEHRTQLDTAAERVVEAGLACWSGGPQARLIIKGQARLLEDITALDDLERVRGLFAALERQETMLRLIEQTKLGEGVQIFIGADNPMFAHTGCSVIITPYMNSSQEVLGAIGVIGPTRIDYGRIIPMVDYTAKVVGRLLP